MIYSQEVENMCPVAQGVNHGAAPIPEEAKLVKSKEVKDISGLTHDRMFWYDPFCSDGSRDSSGKNRTGSIKYRPCL